MLQGWGKGFTGEAISQDVKKNLISIIDEPSPPKQQTAEELKVGEGSLGEEGGLLGSLHQKCQAICCRDPSSCKCLTQVGLVSKVVPVVLNWGWLLTPKGILQCLETSLIIMIWVAGVGGEGCYWHLAGRGQRCRYTSYTAQDSPSPKEGLSTQNVNGAEVEKPCSRSLHFNILGVLDLYTHRHHTTGLDNLVSVAFPLAPLSKEEPLTIISML